MVGPASLLARTAVVWDALDEVLAAGGCDVLDIGGGTGVSAVRIAEQGHRVTVVDPSPDALAALGRRAAEAGAEITSQQGDLADLVDLVAADSFDLVLCHGVLEVVDDIPAALAAIGTVLRPGGALSLLVAQQHAAVVSRALAGHFGQARELLDDPGVPDGRHRSGRRFTVEGITRLLLDAGYAAPQVHGVRVFTDLVPGSLLDAEAGAGQGLLDLERAVAGRPEYQVLAAQLHLLARR
ncbi:methyltransferase domain-containing protein [Nocardioides limicola]|uniref:methyltransferase domain-containing protein n=1 Tax=Nocardioides limicola TaxID=2803368 RepID=UPI00193C066C|nr:methyltransferase domain-containing protein [Nocardioides sp. DJM-14]